VTLTDSLLGITYSFDVLGGQFDPAKPGTLCHTEGAAMFVTLTASNGICAKKLTRRIEAGLQSDQFPNAFTPNGDGSNDVFAPIFGCGVSSMRLRVFNRWGQKVFETTDPARGWDGRYEGADLPSEVYVWTLDYTVDTAGNQTSLVQRGSLTLIR
jgi:gliding motility-associated-like protein